MENMLVSYWSFFKHLRTVESLNRPCFLRLGVLSRCFMQPTADIACFCLKLQRVPFAYIHCMDAPVIEPAASRWIEQRWWAPLDKVDFFVLCSQLRNRFD